MHLYYFTHFINNRELLRYLGSTFAAWTTFGTLQIQSNWSWRLPGVLQVVPSLIQLAFIWLLPESPRFLMAKDRPDEALDVIANYHGNGDRNSEWVRFQIEEIQTSIEMEQNGNQTTWGDLIKTRKLPSQCKTARI